MVHNINIQQLRAFLALMNIGNITRAAEYLNVTQPTVSRQLQLLETSIGFRLFDRKSGGRLITTVEGQRFFEEMEPTLKILEDLPEIANNIVNYRSKRLRIAATAPILNSDIAINAISKLRKLYPETGIHLERCRRERIEASIVNHEADIGLCALPIGNPALDVRSLVTTEAVAVMAEDHRLCDKTVLGVKDVPREDLILPTAAPLYSALQWYDTTSDGLLPPPLRVHLVQTGLRLAEAGLGVAICDPLTAMAMARSTVKIVEWQPKIPIEYGYILPKERQASPVLRALTELLDECANIWVSENTVGVYRKNETAP